MCEGPPSVSPVRRPNGLPSQGSGWLNASLTVLCLFTVDQGEFRGTRSERDEQGHRTEAFDTLFNKHDYAAAELFWSKDYIQHSAHIHPGAKVFSRW